MKGKTENAKEAGNELVQSYLTSSGLERELITEGIYTAVVEGGYHSQKLTDEEADYLCITIARYGLEGLEERL